AVESPEQPNRKVVASFVLSGISVSVPSGGLTALVGPSGAGEPSVGSLLARLYDAAAG
ncbi:MAG: hypothetical protein H8D69_02480, partial [Chloroflexi bacterium]|nr:hypothetical protein [Chloroflexota bacterium]